ncbi:hypothetical protein IGJ68_002129 [Enterococcus sp. DIV0564]
MGIAIGLFIGGEASANEVVLEEGSVAKKIEDPVIQDNTRFGDPEEPIEPIEPIEPEPEPEPGELFKVSYTPIKFYEKELPKTGSASASFSTALAGVVAVGISGLGLAKLRKPEDEDAE